MSFFQKRDLSLRRSEPRVWIGKLALFECIDPITPIRDPIKFHTGLNIVWGVENEANDEKFEPGHGVGKTTLCRLIRYCLGEPTYGQSHAAREILNTFPEGYVAAEVYIDGRRWAVLRPFNKTRADRAQADTTIAELLTNPPLKGSFREYQQQIAFTCLAGLKTEGVLTGGASIDWTHLLALCTRDQEARYQSLWQWRSPRSDSTPRNIQKDDAHRILRSVLGLLPDEETKLQVKIAGLGDELAQVERDIIERMREPDYWTRHYRKTLERDHKIKDAMTASLLDAGDLFGLSRLVPKAVERLEERQEKRRADLKELDRKIGLTAASLQEPAELQEQQSVAATITDSGSATLAAALEELRQLRQLLRDAEHSFCKYGHVSIGTCSHAQKQLVELDQQIRDRSRSASSTVAQRDRVSTKLREYAARKDHLIESLTKELEKLQHQRRTIDNRRHSAQSEIESIQAAMESLLLWETIRVGKEPDSDLAQLQKRKKSFETRLAVAKSKLSELVASQDQSLSKLRTVYESLARKTLSPEFNGRIQLTNEGMEFRVFRGENLSGEAFETLSILLADIAVLLMGSIGAAAHPGLLIHDSPREADLGSHIYRRLLLTVADVADELAIDDVVPFQQIITTTTPPPTTLKKKSTTCLKLGGEEGQLFGRQLHSPDSNQPTLSFDEDSAV